jgi:dTDP-4-amino-4,6-dideoxygalactose transaminase
VAHYRYAIEATNSSKLAYSLNSFLKYGVIMNMMKKPFDEECAEKLRELTCQKYILFTKRGNSSIRLALQLIKSLGMKKVLLQDQGGWITYRQFCDKEHLEHVELPTRQGVLDQADLEKYTDCALLINSMPGYAALQDMKQIKDACKKSRIFVINDCSGSIGTKEGKIGDVLLGSFGADKPVNLGDGGFIAADSEVFFEFFKKKSDSPQLDFELLSARLAGLSSRMNYLLGMKHKAIEEVRKIGLEDNIIHEKEKGYNLIIKFSELYQKEKLINLAEDLRIEHTLCPRDIRINENAVCFEIKRLIDA